MGIGLVAAAVMHLAIQSLSSKVLIFICVVTCCASVLLFNYTWMPPVVIFSGGLIQLLVEERHRFPRLGDLFHQSRHGSSITPTQQPSTPEVLGNTASVSTFSTSGSSAGLLQNTRHANIPTISEFPVVDNPPVIEEPARRIDYFKQAGISSITAGICISLWALFLVAGFITYSKLSSNGTNNLFRLVSAFYIVGAIIFGDGPVMIPLLINYIVAPGWVTPDEFIFGIAMSNVICGPNFSFAAYAGVLSSVHILKSSSAQNVFVSILIGVLCTYATFLPGLLLITAVFPIWNRLRKIKLLMSVLDGIAAAAIGITFGSVFLLYSELRQSAVPGQSLSVEIEFVIIALSFSGAAFFKLNALVLVFMSICVSAIYYAFISS
jgi:chromate transport protein ChrA